MLVTGEGEWRKLNGCDGEGIGGAYFESGEELRGLSFRKLLALEKLPWVGVGSLFSFTMRLFFSLRSGF